MKSTGAIVCYARSSTLEQRAGLEAQIAQLKAAGATKIFAEHVSSVSTVRPKLAEALDYVREHDVFDTHGDTHSFREMRRGNRCGPGSRKECVSPKAQPASEHAASHRRA